MLVLYFIRTSNMNGTV